MDHLLREKAPISDAGWVEIEQEATRTLRHYLAARKIIDYSCDDDWTRSAMPLGRVNSVSSSIPAVELNSRVVLPLTEVRVQFQISRKELEALDRGATDFDTSPVVDAARAAALAEDQTVFGGNSELGISGIAGASSNPTVTFDASFNDFPDAVARALDGLSREGIEGPYGIAMGPEVWTGVMESSESGGYPLIKHLRLLVDGPVVWAPAIDGAVLVSQRGGDFEISGGQDWSIGYLNHDHENITLYLESSFTAVVNTPEASIRFALPS